MYEGDSPDEAALLEGLRTNGVTVRSRSTRFVTVEFLGTGHAGHARGMRDMRDMRGACGTCAEGGGGSVLTADACSVPAVPGFRHG